MTNVTLPQKSCKLLYAECAMLLTILAGNGEHYFPTDVRVRIGDFNSVWIMGACVSPMGEIWLMSTGSTDLWEKLEETDVNYAATIAALHQTLTTH